MNSETYQRPFLFVTGPPRSGTTFLSDWITETEDAYVCHEVLPELSGLNLAERWAFLESRAQTSMDRMQKPKQLEFLAWRERRRQSVPRVLGLKEPVTWTSEEPPEALRALLLHAQSRCIALVRHPFDVVISGLRRGQSSRNWPGYSVEEHCRLWLQVSSVIAWARSHAIPVLVLPWEDLILSQATVKERIEEFIGFPLPAFNGFERSPDELEYYRRTVSRTHGVCDDGQRSLLSGLDRQRITAMLAPQAEAYGYRLDDPKR
jgi:Sulfotransferase family